ncbi:MAG TPA: cupin domain-containing protein [Acidimicrobiales bacterium]
MEHGRKPPTANGPADWFSGDVYVDAVAQAHGDSPATVAFVHFTPGARTAWHSHSIGQSLFVTEGEGRIQARGAPIVILRPCDTVFAPGGEWHWHGAAPDHLMTHLAVSEGTPEWGERVSDEEYLGES